MLALAGARLETGLSPSRHGLASPARNSSRLLEAEAQLWQSRSHARTEMAGKIQCGRSRDLGWSALCQGHFFVAELEPEANLPRYLGQRPLPIDRQPGAPDGGFH